MQPTAESISLWTVLTVILLPIALLAVGLLWRQIDAVKTAAAADRTNLWSEIAKLRAENKYFLENYVRRDDLATHLSRIESGQEKLGDKVDRLTESIVAPLTRLAEALNKRD